MTATSTGRVRRLVAGVAAAGLSVIGLAVIAPPSEGATLQNVGVSISSDTTVFTSTVTKTDFVVTNPSANTGSVALYTIVVPPGVGKVTPAGVTGPGNWGETVLPCGSTANCSSLVLVYTGFPLSTSVLKPGQSMTASISFTTPDSPTSLPFKFIGIGGGVFTTTDTPTLTVVSGQPAKVTVTGTPGGTSLTAGETGHFTLQTYNNTSQKVPFGGGTVRISLGTDDPQAKLTYGATTVGFTAKSGPIPSYADIVLPQSSTGSYDVDVQFFAAGGSSVTASIAGLADGTYEPVTVSPGPAFALTLGNVTDVTASNAFAAGDTIDVPVRVKDQWGNILPLTDGSVTLAQTGGNGTWVQTSVVAQDSEGFLHIQGTYKKADTLAFSVTYGSTGPSANGSQAFVAAAPANIALGVTDLDNDTKFYVNDLLQFDFAITDAYSNPIPVDGSAVLFNVSSSSPNSFTRTGTALNQVKGRYGVPGQATFSVQYGTATSNLITKTFSFIDTAGSAVFFPGTGGSISSLNTAGTTTLSCTDANACADVNLTNGANGRVTVSSGASNVSVIADFKAADGVTPLYTAAAPALVKFVCTIEFCPLNLAPSLLSNYSSSDDRVSNSAVVGSTCQNGGKVLQDIASAGGYKYCIYNAWEESVEYAKSYRLSATDSAGTTFPEVRPCQNSTINGLKEGGPALASVKTVPAGTKFCIDITNVTRDLVTGDITFPVYFYDDLNLVVKKT